MSLVENRREFLKNAAGSMAGLVLAGSFEALVTACGTSKENQSVEVMVIRDVIQGDPDPYNFFAQQPVCLTNVKKVGEVTVQDSYSLLGIQDENGHQIMDLEKNPPYQAIQWSGTLVDIVEYDRANNPNAPVPTFTTVTDSDGNPYKDYYVLSNDTVNIYLEKYNQDDLNNPYMPGITGYLPSYEKAVSLQTSQAELEKAKPDAILQVTLISVPTDIEEHGSKLTVDPSISIQPAPALNPYPKGLPTPVASLMNNLSERSAMMQSERQQKRSQPGLVMQAFHAIARRP